MTDPFEKQSHALPPGQWMHGRSRFPDPLTPLCADYRMLDLLVQGFRRAFDSASIPLPAPANIVIDGYWYGGPNGKADTSPERVAAFEAYVSESREERLAPAWEVIKPGSERLLQELQRADLPDMDHSRLRDYISRVLDAGRETMAVHHINAVGYAVQIGRLGLFAERELGLSEAQVVAMLGGASPASREPALALARLAREIGSDARLRQALDDSVDAIHPDLMPIVQPWLDEYGYRNPAFEFDQPLIVEQPQLLAKLLREAMAGSAVTEAPTAGLDAAVEVSVPAEHRAEFERLLAGARQAYAMRDDDVSHLQWSQGLQRLAFLEVGRRLVETGVIDSAEDVWYLSRIDMEEYLEAGGLRPMQLVVAERRQARERQAQTRPPAMRGEPIPFQPPPLSAAAREFLQARAWTTVAMDAGPGKGANDTAEIRGIGASSGAYTGVACVVSDESEFDKIQPGDVLVCKMTTPSWNFVFSAVGALVTDFGGQLSHPAIIAREFGIPAVVGTVDATQRIPDGSTVTVDGAAGTVRWE
ncbi:MAG: PEP-utilizing enzyme [bacterium]